MARTLTTISLLLVTFLTLAQGNNSDPDIFKQLAAKDYVELEKNLKAGARTDVYNANGLTPIWMAVFKNDTTGLRLLIKYKADVNFLEKNGMHPIMIGCMTNSIECVKILLDNGVDVNWRSPASRNQQPIRFASKAGSLELVALLLARGADMESTPDDKCTPLLAAIHAKNFELAEFYFQSGANVNVVGRDGECVVHEAILSKNPKMVKMALEHHAPLDIKDPSGKTTLQLAKESGNVEIKEMVKDALQKK